MAGFLSHVKAVWSLNRALEEVGIRTNKLSSQFRSELRGFAVCYELSPEELAAVLVRKDASLVSDLYAALDVVSNWRNQGKIRDTAFDAACVAYSEMMNAG